MRWGDDYFLKNKNIFTKCLCKFIHLFAFDYKDLHKVTLETHKIEFVLNAKAVSQKPYQMNLKHVEVVKIELKKLLKVGFIQPVENIE